MEFKTRYSSFVMMNIFMVLLFFAAGSLEFFMPHINGFRHYIWFGYFLMSFSSLAPIYRTIYADIINKPFLTVNENYIYDFRNDIKYCWKDIETIDAELPFLYINLYHPEDYLDEIGNPHRRFVTKLWFKPDRKKSLFVINLDLVYVDQNELIEILDDYGTKAEIEWKKN